MWRSGNQRHGGYTAIELLTTMAIMAIVTAIAVPSFRDFLQNNRAAEQANALVGALALARNEAVTRGSTVTVCASNDAETCSASRDWSTGWIVFTDANAPAGSVDNGANPDTVLRALPALPPGAELLADVNFVPFAANGFLRNGAIASNFNLTVPDCTGTNNRNISINLQGRVSLARVACPSS